MMKFRKQALTLNHELNNVNNWLTSNSICINADKTKYMIFSFRKLLHLTNIKMGSATIEETNNIKFLGIIFDKHITFKRHVGVTLLLLLKKVVSARLGQSDIHPISPKTPAPQYQPIDRKKRKGKRVEDYSRDRAA